MFNINLDTHEGEFLPLEKLKENSISFSFGHIVEDIHGNIGSQNFTGNIPYRGQNFNKLFNYYNQTKFTVYKRHNGSNNDIMKNKFVLGFFVCKQDNFHFTKIEKENRVSTNYLNTQNFSYIMKVKKLLRNGTLIELGSIEKTNKDDATPFIFHGDFVLNKGDVFVCEHILDCTLATASGSYAEYTTYGDYTLYL